MEVINIISKFDSEIKQVKSQICENLNQQKPNYQDYIALPLNKLDWSFSPALIFAVSSLNHFDPSKTARLAEIVQNIFLASYIHHSVTDKDHEVSMKYRVLFGDYLLGLAFLKLSSEDLFRYMKDFTKLIQTINEGVILRWQSKNLISSDNWKIILSKEKASIIALGAKTAAQITGLNIKEIEIAENLGYNLGMVWAIIDEPLDFYLAQPYLQQAGHLIEKLHGHTKNPYLSELYTAFLKELV